MQEKRQDQQAVKVALLQILGAGILSIRIRGENGDAVYCAAEADHLHNIPSLLADFRDKYLLHYWFIDKPAYVARIGIHAAGIHRNSWALIEKYISGVSGQDGGGGDGFR